MDAFGQIGVDPGSQWTGGGQDDTLRRKDAICTGDMNPDDPFDASVEWDTFAINTFDGLGSHTATCSGGDTPPEVASTSPTDGMPDVSTRTDIVITFSEDVTVEDSWFDITCGVNGYAAAVTGGPLNYILDPVENFMDGESCTVTINAVKVSDLDGIPDTMTADYTFSFTAVDLCNVDYTPIHDIQSSGPASPLEGNPVSIQAIVIGDFQDGAAGTNGDLNGFFVQEEDADVDADINTSEGIFVYDGSSPAVDVKIGDIVRVSGTVAEYNDLSEINNTSLIVVCDDHADLPAVSTVSLPVSAVDDFEKYEGMLVTFPQELVISEYFNFDRFGEIVLTSERHLTPSAEVEPGPEAIQAAEDFLLDKITLDDGRTVQNPDPALHPNGVTFDLSNLFRGGDTVQNVTGVMDYSFNIYRIQPTQGADYINTNPRTVEPDVVGGNLRVASFNVLNYFSTLDDGVNDICGPAQNLECRGADDANEFTRQRDKIIAAITATGADVVGLLEIENNINDDAVLNLIEGLNAASGAGTFDYVNTGVIGTDAIKVAMIYKPASVTLIGDYAILDSSVDPRFIDTLNRPALAQTFMDNATGGIFTVAVNHLKSKGSACNDVGDPDLGDGAGNCNLTRKYAAEALVDWLAGDPTGSGDADFLIIGDLNAYDKEDPIDAILAGGYTDMIYTFLGERRLFLCLRWPNGLS